jgi:hypothetical protein
MRAKGLATAAGSSAFLLCLLASASPAQERARQRAPIIRVYSENGAGVVSNYVRPVIDVNRDAYVFAVMMDLDGHLQVLHPDFPGISVRLQSEKRLRLPNFFAGFNDTRNSSRYGMASYDRYGTGADDVRGTVIALASHVPFNLRLIEADGDWDLSAIRRLIENRTPEGAAQALARYLGAKGEAIGHDYLRFAGGRQSYYAYNNYGNYGYCGYNSDFYSAFGRFYGGQGFSSLAALHAAGLRPLFLGYDACGLPIFVASPFNRGERFPFPFRPGTRPPGDTTVFPKSHFPQGIARRPTPEGVFPIPQRGELPQLSDVTITAPRGRRAEPREIIQGFRPQPGSASLPERARQPIERTVPSRTEPASTGMRPVYRPQPRVVEPSQPVRAPERVREPARAPTPAPVVHERPAQPSSPPPRAEPSRSKPEPAPTPPPRG